MKTEKYDYIIAGAGTAGCILAHRLTDAGHRVLLVEAGGSDNHWTVRMPGGLRAHYKPNSRFNYHYNSVPQKHLNNREIYQPRGRALGGSASINGMVFLRGHALDYERWVKQGAQGWGYDDVLPYFKRLESCEAGADAFRGGSGPVNVRRQTDLSELDQAFLAAGRDADFAFTEDVNGAEQEGFCRFDMNVDKGVRASTAYAYLHKFKGKVEPTVKLNTLVEKIVFEDDRAVGIQYRQGRDSKIAYAQNEVILSLGAFGTPQLLMLSGIGPAEHLHAMGIKSRVELPGVGQNLQDHLEVHIQHHCTKPVSLNRYLRPDRMVQAGLRWFAFKTGVCARNQANTGAFLKTNDSVAHPNIQFHFFPVFFDGWNPRHDVSGYLLDTGPMRPTSVGEVLLKSDDPLQSLAIDPNFFATERDREETIDGFELGREALRQPAFAQYDAGEAIPGPQVKTRKQIEGFIREHAGSAYHPCGTCKMGADDDPFAVVDAGGNVRGVKGLRVVDASIMPSIASSNINAVVMMIAEKLSDTVLGHKPL
jgi:choline dehydrogenase